MTMDELAYAVVEGKWVEAKNIAEAYYAEKPHLADDHWDPRVDAGGRHADHPDFGRDTAPLWLDAAGWWSLAIGTGVVGGTWAAGYNLGILGVFLLWLLGVSWAVWVPRMWVRP